MTSSIFAPAILVPAIFAFVLHAAGTALLAQNAVPGSSARVPACGAKQITLTTDAGEGRFDSTSHSGTLIVVRNHGTTACSILPKPQFGFTDGAGQRLALSWRAPVGMHPGPVQVPVVIPPGGVATATATWVSNSVYEHSRCIEATSINLVPDATAAGRVQAPMRAAIHAHVCSPAGTPVTYRLDPFRPDPTYKRSEGRH